MLLIQIPLIGESAAQIPLDIQIPAKKRGNPTFKPKWHSPTKAIRIPEKYADTAIKIFQAFDDKNLAASAINIDSLLGKSEAYSIDSQTGYQRAEVYKIPTVDLKTDPKRFQYKLIQYDAIGSTNSLKGISQWDDNLAGTLLIWQDPIDSQLYIVNGHNRYGRAMALGVDYLKCEFLAAANASEARAIGALRNIAEGNGTAIDAAKFFRDQGLTSDEIQRSGKLPLAQSTVKDGASLAALTGYLFDRVIDGRLTIADGAIIGRELDQALQATVIEALDKGISGNDLIELCTLINASDSQQIEQSSLFGTEQFTVCNAIERAQKIAWLKQRLSKDRRIFGTVARNDQALAKGNNKIDAMASKAIADQSKQALLLFDQLKLQAGPLASLINSAANGAIDNETYYSQVLALLANPFTA